MAGCSFTFSVNDCVALVPTPLLAVMVTTVAPPVPAAGVPVSTPVAAFSVRPEGRVVEVKEGAG